MEDKVVEIHHINFVEKWVEFWVDGKRPPAQFTLCCKAYQLQELVDASEDKTLQSHIWNRGYRGLWMRWEHNGNNWEPKSITTRDLGLRGGMAALFPMIDPVSCIIGLMPLAEKDRYAKAGEKLKVLISKHRVVMKPGAELVLNFERTFGKKADQVIVDEFPLPPE